MTLSDVVIQEARNFLDAIQGFTNQTMSLNQFEEARHRFQDALRDWKEDSIRNPHLVGKTHEAALLAERFHQRFKDGNLLNFYFVTDTLELAEALRVYPRNSGFLPSTQDDLLP